MDKVLIVGVDKIFLRSIGDGLQKYVGQFEVMTAPDREAALSVLKRERISVLIADIVIPKTGGLELFAQMRKKHPQVPCIAMTEPGAPEIKNEAVREGIFRTIEKPFESNELAALIIEGLDGLDEGLFWKNYRT